MKTTSLALIALFLLLSSNLFAQSGKVYDNLSLPSKILKSERKYAVYLPPDYETSDEAILYRTCFTDQAMIGRRAGYSLAKY